MLIPILIGLGAATAAYFLRKYLRKKFEENNYNQSNKFLKALAGTGNSQLAKDLLKDLQNGNINKSGPGDWDTLPKKYKPILDLWKGVDKIVKEIKFFQKRIVVRHKIGEEPVASKIPTGDMEIEPIKGFDDLPQALPGELGSDDDMFYAKVATKNILMQQPIEYEGIYEDKYFQVRKTLRGLQDCSGSTKGDRIVWSKILNYLLVEKSQKESAELSITTFTNFPEHTITATPEDQKSYTKVKSFIDDIYDHGGTSINNAMINELEIIEKENKEHKHIQDTQIVLITDGTEGIEEEVIKQKMKDNKVTLHTVILGESNSQLKSVSDKFHYLNIAGEILY